MKITQQETARKLGAYLRHELPLEDLVGWAENAMMDGEFTQPDNRSLRDVVARIGLADVRAFGLAWDDCEQLLASLGYRAKVEVVAA